MILFPCAWMYSDVILFTRVSRVDSPSRRGPSSYLEGLDWKSDADYLVRGLRRRNRCRRARLHRRRKERRHTSPTWMHWRLMRSAKSAPRPPLRTRRTSLLLALSRSATRRQDQRVANAEALLRSIPLYDILANGSLWIVCILDCVLICVCNIQLYYEGLWRSTIGRRRCV